ncbi:MAG: DNA pilot protein [Microvirus sp.]|nr:MAG: DNA pilot protein [Microvirus sp.]
MGQQQGQGGILGQASSMPGWVAPTMGAISNAASSLFGWIGQKRQNEAQRKYETEMYQKNKQDQIDFWNMQNQYNSPAMQMQRLKAAGLNPNLVYGNGADAQSGNLTAPSPSVTNSTKFNNPIDSSIGLDAMSMMRGSAQTDLIQAQTATQLSIQKMNAFTAALTAINASKGNVELGILPQQLSAALSKTISETAEIGTRTRMETASTEKIQTESKNIVNEFLLKLRNNPYQIKLLTQQVLESKQRVKESQANVGLVPYHKEQIQSSILNTDMKTALDQLDYLMKNNNQNPNASGISRVIGDMWSSMLSDNDTVSTRPVYEAIQKIKFLRK